MKFEGKSSDDFPKLPTLLQYCKAAQEAELKPIRIVQKIWLPNKFRSITFDTEKYRLRLSDSSPLYTPILEFIPTAEEQEACLAIRICDAKAGTYEIEVLENEKCVWELMGEYGRKLTVQERKRGKK